METRSTSKMPGAGSVTRSIAAFIQLRKSPNGAKPDSRDEICTVRTYSNWAFGGELLGNLTPDRSWLECSGI